MDAWLFGAPSALRALAEGDRGEVALEVTLALIPGKLDNAAAATARGAGRAVQAVERHHLLPRQFRDRFERAGLDIKKFVVELPRDRHRLKPDGRHTGSNHWNKRWDKFFELNPRAGADEILRKLSELQQEFGLP